MSLKEGTDYHFDVRLHSHFRFPRNIFCINCHVFVIQIRAFRLSYDGNVISMQLDVAPFASRKLPDRPTNPNQN
jgi:hypothetical protein